RAASPFTSGTTSGTPGSWRNALDLSTTMAPASTAAGASARDWAEPAEKNASSMPRNGASLATSTGMASPRNVTWRPAERADANARSERTGKSRSSRIRSVVVPAAPVAPTSAIACPAPMLDGGRLDVSGTQQPLIVQDRLGCHIRKVDRRQIPCNAGCVEYLSTQPTVSGDHVRRVTALVFRTLDGPAADYRAGAFLAKETAR